MRAIETHLNEGRSRFNQNWITEVDEYQAFLDDLLACGIGVYALGPDRQVQRNYPGWSTQRLEEALTGWDTIIERCLHFGNSFNVNWVLPVAEQNRTQVIAELRKRATPHHVVIPDHYKFQGWLEDSKVVQSIDFFDVYAQYLLNFEHKWKHKVAYATCPWHKDGNEKHPSLMVNMETGRWRCFACHLTGGVFDFVSRLENCDHNTAVGIVAKLGGYSE